MTDMRQMLCTYIHPSSAVNVNVCTTCSMGRRDSNLSGSRSFAVLLLNFFLSFFLILTVREKSTKCTSLEHIFNKFTPYSTAMATSPKLFPHFYADNLDDDDDEEEEENVRIIEHDSMTPLSLFIVSFRLMVRIWSVIAFFWK